MMQISFLTICVSPLMQISFLTICDSPADRHRSKNIFMEIEHQAVRNPGHMPIEILTDNSFCTLYVVLVFKFFFRVCLLPICYIRHYYTKAGCLYSAITHP